MKVEFLISNDLGVVDYPALEPLSTSATPLEDCLVLGFARADEITFYADHEHKDAIFICLSNSRNKNETIHGKVSTEELIAKYGKFLPLCEEVDYFADKPGFAPKIEWFEARNKQLGITWSDDFDAFQVPPRSLVSLMLSYVFSSGGMATIRRQLGEDRNYRVRYQYSIRLVFFGKPDLDSERCWEERLYLWEERLKKHIERKQSSTKPKSKIRNRQ